VPNLIEEKENKGGGVSHTIESGLMLTPAPDDAGRIFKSQQDS